MFRIGGLTIIANLRQPVYLSFVIRKASNIVAMQMDRGVTNSQVRSGLTAPPSQYFLVKIQRMFCMPRSYEDCGF